MYLSETIAVEALIEAHIHFDFNSRGGPIAVYRCDDCGQFHLTSQGVMHPKLKEYLASGKLDRQKEINRWMDKLKSK